MKRLILLSSFPLLWLMLCKPNEKILVEEINFSVANPEPIGNQGGRSAASGLGFVKIWNKHFGGSNADQPTKTIPTADGGVLMIGHTFSNDHDIRNKIGNGSNVWALKLTASGEVQWSKIYDQTFNDFPYNEPASVTEFPDGSGYLIAIRSSVRSLPASRPESGWMLKTDNQGAMKWKKNVEGYIFYHY